MRVADSLVVGGVLVSYLCNAFRAPKYHTTWCRLKPPKNWLAWRRFVKNRQLWCTDAGNFKLTGALPSSLVSWSKFRWKLRCWLFPKESADKYRRFHRDHVTFKFNVDFVWRQNDFCWHVDEECVTYTCDFRFLFVAWAVYVCLCCRNRFSTCHIREWSKKRLRKVTRNFYGRS